MPTKRRTHRRQRNYSCEDRSYSTFGGAAERAVELSLQRSEGVTIVMNDEDGTNYVTISAKVETQYAGYSRRG